MNFKQSLDHDLLSVLDSVVLQELPQIPQRWDNLAYKLLDFPLVHNVLPRHLQCETEKLEKLFGDNRAEGHTFQAVLASLLVGLEALLGKLLEQLHIFELAVLLL